MNRNNKEDTTVKSLKIEKFKSLSLVALLIASVTLASCSSDDGDSEPKNVLEAGKTYILTVDARKGSDVTTRALNLSGSTLNATWAKAEKVFVKQYDNWLEGSLSPDANGETARLNGEIKNITGELPLSEYLFLQYPQQTWNYTGQHGTIADIAANFDYATATAHITKINGSNISASSSVTFTNQQAIVMFTLKDKNKNDAPINATSLSISASGLAQSVDVSHSSNEYTFTNTLGDITVTPSSAKSEIFVALRGVNGNVTLTAKTEDKTYTYYKSEAAFDHGKYYEIDVKMKEKTYPINLSAVTPDYIGSVVCTDGTVYADCTAATLANKTPVAMIAYVSGTGSGLAIALNDENEQKSFDGAQLAARAKNTENTVSGGDWRLPQIEDWRNMFRGCCNGKSANDTSAKVEFGSIQSKLKDAGRKTIQKSNYWSYSVYGSSRDGYYTVSFGDGTAIITTLDYTEIEYNVQYNVRACLAFPKVTQ